MITTAERWLLHGSNILVGGTGLLYGWMLYFLEPQDAFTVVNHPAQPTVQHLHVLTAPLLVFAVGVLWKEHAWKHVREGKRRRRKSGLFLIGIVAPMVVSGYLLQVSVDPLGRKIWMVVHVATSLIWILASLIHLRARFKSG